MVKMQPQNDAPKPAAAPPVDPPAQAPPRPQSLPVRPAPAEDESATPAAPLAAAPKPKPAKSAQGPTGTVVLTVVGMIGLSVLAIAIYMTSKR